MITFQEALAQTSDVKRHLLLGNGFSISLFPERFHYNSLLESVDFTAYPETRQAFNALATTDFEMVINALRQSATLLPLYDPESETANLMRNHAGALKTLLVQAIAGRHPERPGDVSDEQYQACRTFLAHFAGDSRNNGQDLRGHIYTLNYDLLALLDSTARHVLGTRPGRLASAHRRESRARRS